MNLTIQMVGVSERIQNKCIENKLTSLGELLEMDELELIHRLQINLYEVDELVAKISEKVTPPFRMKNLKEMDTRPQRKNPYIRTGFPALDEKMGGGIPVGSITEIAGESTMGKTTFCQTLSTEIGKVSSILYIDTEDNTGGIQRIHEILKAKYNIPQNNNNQQRRNVFGTVRSEDDSRIQSIIKAIRFENISNTDELVRYLENDAENYIYDHSIGLLILDSVAFPIRRDVGNWIERSDILGKIACALKRIAENCIIPVVVTNHFTYGRTISMFNTSSYGNDSSTNMKAALGNTWSHCVNTRLVMKLEKDIFQIPSINFSGGNQMGNSNNMDGSRIPKETRTITVEKSPIVGNSSIVYRITNAGIVIDQESSDRSESTKRQKTGNEGIVPVNTNLFNQNQPVPRKKKTLSTFSLQDDDEEDSNFQF